MIGLNYKNTDARKRADIKQEMRKRGFTQKNWPKALNEVPEDLRPYYVVVIPDFYA